MSNRKRQADKDRSRPYSAEWHRQVKAEAMAALLRARIRDAAARAARDELKAARQEDLKVRCAMTAHRKTQRATQKEINAHD